MFHSALFYCVNHSRYSENARSARYAKPKPIICEKQCSVDPVLASKYRYGPGNYDEPDRRRVGSPRIRNDSDKKDKFPHHLYHIEPEDDPKATRTLFVGNLSSEIEDHDLREHFEKYGVIEDIDIKRPAKGTTNNSYAFVKYANLDMAHRAKVNMSGKMIRTFQCKIGYGKVTPTKCLWVGGLGPWVQYDVLEKAFSHFGTIQEIDWPLNKYYAYILFDNVEAAVAACDHLRGFKLGDADKRIRVDFSDEVHIHNDPGTVKAIVSVADCCGSAGGVGVGGRQHHRVGEISLICGDTYRFSGGHNIDAQTVNKRITVDHHGTSAAAAAAAAAEMSLENSTVVLEMIKFIRHVWTGRFFLKNNCFGGKIYYLRGEEKMIDHFLQPVAPVSATRLQVDVKLKLDYHLLDEVYSRISAGGDEGICILLAVAENVDAVCGESVANDNGGGGGVNAVEKKEEKPKSVMQRHLKALSAYLRIKQSAGKIILQSAADDATGFGALHVFPPCAFSHKLLVDSSPLLTSDYARDDFLLLILIRCY